MDFGDVFEETTSSSAARMMPNPATGKLSIKKLIFIIKN